MPIPTLTTSRLSLRPFSLDDLDSLHLILQEPDILKYFPNPAPPGRDRVERLIINQLVHWDQHGFGWWAVAPNEGGQLTGWCGLTFLPETGEVEVAYLLSRAWWGQGLTTEAAGAALKFGFEQVGLDRIIAIVHPDNRASQRVAEKNGLVFVDRNRYFGMDCFRYEILRSSAQAEATETYGG